MKPMSEDEWMVRVAGKEYGPVDLDDLRDWKQEGRLIATNEVRKVGEERWMPASELAGVFLEPETEPARASLSPTYARSWSQIISETFQVYWRGLGRFLLFGLLNAVPLFALQWSLPKLTMPTVNPDGTAAMNWPAISPISIVLLLLVFALWPVSIAAFQFIADDIVCGRTRPLGHLLRAALARWTQVLATALFVYAAYFFWFAVPFSVLIGLAGSGQISILGTLLFLFISCVMVYMNARLFINFLFWQPAAALRPHGALSALRESKELARCTPNAPRLERPLYRGVIVASLWLLAILVLTFAVQIPFMMLRFAGVKNQEEALALARALAETKSADTLAILADVASASVSLFLQPLLAAAFIVLYYDARARAGRRERDDEPL